MRKRDCSKRRVSLQAPRISFPRTIKQSPHTKSSSCLRGVKNNRAIYTASSLTNGNLLFILSYRSALINYGTARTGIGLVASR